MVQLRHACGHHQQEQVDQFVAFLAQDVVGCAAVFFELDELLALVHCPCHHSLLSSTLHIAFAEEVVVIFVWRIVVTLERLVVFFDVTKRPVDLCFQTAVRQILS